MNSQYQPLIRQYIFYVLPLLLLLLFSNCSRKKIPLPLPPSMIEKAVNKPSNVLDYIANPNAPQYRKAAAFSDQGAWFGYGLPADSSQYGGFAGPFLMTQENGVWASPVLSQLKLMNYGKKEVVAWGQFELSQHSYLSHLEQTYQQEGLEIKQVLFFDSPHTAITLTTITNKSNEALKLIPTWEGTQFVDGMRFQDQGDDNMVPIISAKSEVAGYIQVLKDPVASIHLTDLTYTIRLKPMAIAPQKSKTLILTHSFIFPEYEEDNELEKLAFLPELVSTFFEARQQEKEKQLAELKAQMNPKWNEEVYQNLLVKCILTLQNNWRIPAGELKHSGLFPSYHKNWFHGFWAWDSWKHAVALSKYDPTLAKEQVRAMYDFQQKNGFISDCVFRDTTIEKHNNRNTKPPLSAWAVWNIYEEDQDSLFLREMYPKMVKQHRWWYEERDHDQNGLCEYGCTDGTLVAAKWESGMDNAVRFDDSQILNNQENAYSLNQESVDLNSYLYAEKIYLQKIAHSLAKTKDAEQFEQQASVLKNKIQEQFFDEETGWFYDKRVNAKALVPVMGCEGWIPLWAGVASKEQAKAVMQNMMDETHFNTKVPFQTLSAAHPKFTPQDGYWRGPNWLDQAYFGIIGLRNYGYNKEADAAAQKIFQHAQGVLEKGSAIRENYNPITGEGLAAEHFSWSAGHLLLLLLEK